MNVLIIHLVNYGFENLQLTVDVRYNELHDKSIKLKFGFGGFTAWIIYILLMKFPITQVLKSIPVNYFLNFC